MGDTFSNEELTAYLDGECAPELVAKIDAALKTDVEFRNRLDRLAINKDEIRVAFEQLKPKSASIHKAANQNVEFSFAKAAAGILLGVFIGGGAMYFSTASSQQDWTEAVASYQALYTTDTLKFVEQSDDELTSELARVSAALGKTLNLEELRSFDALNYRRGQVLSFEGRPLIQLAFLTADGKAVALCITKAGGAPDREVAFSKLHGMEAASWSKEDFNFIIIGGEDKALISKAAKLFQERV